MPVKGIAPWFGAKRILAKTICEELGDHVQYFEPFCGSLAVLLVKPKSRQETVNDLHGDLINLARVVADPKAAVALYERLQSQLVGDYPLKEARAHLELDDPGELTGSEVSGPHVSRAYWYFVLSWMSRNGIAGLARQDYQLAVRWSTGGGSPTVRWRSAVESLPAWHQRLQNVVILNRDGFDIIPRFEDAPGTSIYVDPPYPHETRSAGQYLHDFQSEDTLFGRSDHFRLAELLNSFEHARVVVSSYDCQTIRNLYTEEDGWRVVDCSMRKNLQNSNRKGTMPAGTAAPEILLVRGKAAR